MDGNGGLSSVLAALWAVPKLIFADGSPLHAGALILFLSLIPFFSICAVWGVTRVASRRLTTLLAAFPALEATKSYEAFRGSISKIDGWRYVMPLVFLFGLNFFLSMVMLDGAGWTDDLIVAERRVFLLCGSRCTAGAVDAGGAPFNLGKYETDTLVVVAYAFLGWMVWTFISIFDRAATQQLFPATFNRLVVRLAVAVLVAVVVRHLAADYPNVVTASGPVLAFAIGMFPERGFALISRWIDTVVSSNARSEAFNLELIEGIDAPMTYRLGELGIGSAADLARINPFMIFQAVAVPMSLVVDWIAQAQLLMRVKADRFQTLQKAGYRTLFDVVRLLRSANGPDTVRTLCNWVIPAGFDEVAAIEADGDYLRLRATAQAVGMVGP